MKLLLSLLGTGDYTPVQLHIPWRPEAERPEPDQHHQEGLRRAIVPDRCWLIGTIDAQKKHGASIPHDEFVIIPKGRTDPEFWAIFETIVGRLEGLEPVEDGWEIHLDLTNGIRVQPMFLLAAIRYACRMSKNGVRLAEVYYNAFERGDPTSSLLQATALLEMDEVAQDLHVFLSHAAVGPLAMRLKEAESSRRRALVQQVPDRGLSQPERRQRMGELIAQDPMIGLLSRIGKSLDRFGAVVGINHTPTAARTTRELCDLAHEAETAFHGALAPIGRGLAAMRSGLLPHLPSDPHPLWGWHAALARWCLERGLAQQAMTHAEEMVVTRACEEAGANPLDLETRERIGAPLKAMGRLDGTPVPDAWSELIAAWTSVSDARNQVNHAFTSIGSSAAELADPAQVRNRMRGKVEALLAANARLSIFPPVPNTPPTARPAEAILRDLEVLLLSWKDGTEERVAQLRQECTSAWPTHSGLVDQLIAKRTKAAALTEAAYQQGRGFLKRPWDALLNEAESLGLPGLMDRMAEKRSRGDCARQRFLAERQRAQRGGHLSSVRPRPHVSIPVQPVAASASARLLPPPPVGLHPNDIRSLQSQSAWRLLLDETGSDFGGDGPQRGKLGRFVGLLVSAMNPGLRPLRSGWHAVDCSDPAEIDIAVQQVLDAPCGIIGFPVSALPNAPGERWLDGMRVLIDWVLRLLPINGSTRLDVIIEARPPFRPGTEPDAIRRDALALLARAWPDRANQIDLRIKIEQKDGNALLAHVDALAFTWGSSVDSSRERLRRSGLSGTCLLNFSAADLAACWDAWDQPGGLAPSRWAELVSSPDAGNPASIASAILAALAATCRAEPQRWRTYMDEAQQHLFRGPVNLARVGAMVDWLQQAKPADADLLPALRLVWLTASLARANHLGTTEHTWLEELTVLSARLQDEDAPLCCHADLHRAVAATNRFDFAGAAQALESWQAVSPAIPGLRYWGQLRSSLGQHYAFTNDQPRARAAFAEAIATFERLSDPDLRRKEIDQTSCYAAIAAMDDRTLDTVGARAALTSYMGDLAVAIPRLAASDDADRYQHHALLRWLIERGDPADIDAYLALRPAWQSGHGHPWPLIELYRGLLLRPRDPAAALNQALDAAGLGFAAQQGPTVRLIGACCRAVAVAWGTPWPEADGILTGMRQDLPLAVDRLDRLAAFLRQPEEPRTMLRQVLPFNFR